MEIILYEATFKTRSNSLSRTTIKRILKVAGYNLIVASVLIAVVCLGPLLSQEISYRIKPVIKPSLEKKPQNSKQSLSTQDIQQQLIIQEAQSYGVSADFSVVIPKINAKANIIPNVNPADEAQYKAALKKGVGHAAGTKFPGSNSPIFLFAHSANTPTDIVEYNAVFYLLKELEKEDKIIIFFTGQKFVYKVIEQFVTTADDIQWLTHQDNQEKLVLQTCWPPGTIQKRLIVVAKPV